METKNKKPQPYTQLFIEKKKNENTLDAHTPDWLKDYDTSWQHWGTMKL